MDKEILEQKLAKLRQAVWQRPYVINEVNKYFKKFFKENPDKIIDYLDIIKHYACFTDYSNIAAKNIPSKEEAPAEVALIVLKNAVSYPAITKYRAETINEIMQIAETTISKKPKHAGIQLAYVKILRRMAKNLPSTYKALDMIKTLQNYHYANDENTRRYSYLGVADYVPLLNSNDLDHLLTFYQEEDYLLLAKEKDDDAISSRCIIKACTNECSNFQPTNIDNLCQIFNTIINSEKFDPDFTYTNAILPLGPLATHLGHNRYLAIEAVKLEHHIVNFCEEILDRTIKYNKNFNTKHINQLNYATALIETFSNYDTIENKLAATKLAIKININLKIAPEIEQENKQKITTLKARTIRLVEKLPNAINPAQYQLMLENLLKTAPEKSNESLFAKKSLARQFKDINQQAQELTTIYNSPNNSYKPN